MSRKIMAVVNPVSANGSTGSAWPKILETARELGLELDWQLTTGPGAATVMAREALEKGYRTIVAVGGDGTINEVVNGFFEDDRPLVPEAALGVVSRGTGCDFIRTLGIPKDPKEALRRLLDDRTTAVDIGKAVFAGPGGVETRRYFVNIADFGLGAATAERVNRTTKAFGGFASFLYGVISTLLTYRNKRVEVALDGGEPIGMVSSILVVANGRCFGGGMRIAPNASPSDGLFDVIIVGDMTRPELVMNLPRVYRGIHLTHPKVSSFRARRVRVTSGDRVLLELDGEQPGTSDGEFTVIPSALRVRV